MTELVQLYYMLPFGDSQFYWSVQSRGKNNHICVKVSAKTNKPTKQEFTANSQGEAIRQALRALNVFLPEDTKLNSVVTSLQTELGQVVAHLTRPSEESGEDTKNSWAVWTIEPNGQWNNKDLCGYIGCESDGWYFVKNPGVYTVKDTRQPNMLTAFIACYCRYARRDFSPHKV